MGIDYGNSGVWEAAIQWLCFDKPLFFSPLPRLNCGPLYLIYHLHIHSIGAHPLHFLPFVLLQEHVSQRTFEYLLISDRVQD